MASYSEIRKGCASRARYADGGRISKVKTPGKVVVNVISSPPVAGGTPPMPPAAPMGNSPSPAGPPVPPQAAQAMLGEMSGKPTGFARGGRIKSGAESGPGRLEKAARARKK